MRRLMKAVILREPGRLELTQVPVPEPKPGELLIKVGACGICGSDVRYYMGENPWALHTLGVDEPMPGNVILGHEVAGEVVEAGSPDDSGRVGERVGIIAFNTCGTCYYCRRGLHNLCENTLHIGHDGRWRGVKYVPGGYAEYMPVWSDKAHRIPDSISFIEATQLDGLAVAVHAVNRAAVRPGDSALVVGAGAIGLMILQVARTYGATKVVAVDVRGKPLEVASELGADGVINAAEEDVVKKAREVTGGLGFDAVFDTVGSAESLTKGLKCLARGGRYVLLAVTKEKVEIEITALAGERVLTTSANNLFPEYTTAVELMASGRVRAKPFITHVFKLDEVHEAFRVALNKEEYDAIKVVLVP
ncbi:MAG: hypothetical protein DRJ56_02240 [Thermoprotei archaeon]|nr:MAG: hypothetical protein DRJ56_02240 [Thermoprotei archaeon]